MKISNKLYCGNVRIIQHLKDDSLIFQRGTKFFNFLILDEKVASILYDLSKNTRLFQTIKESTANSGTIKVYIIGESLLPYPDIKHIYIYILG